MDDRQARPTIYLAARYSRRAELRGYVPLFEAAGFEVVSRWLTTDQHADVAGSAPEDEGADTIDGMTPAQQAAIAEMDLDDVYRADVFVAFTEPPGSAGGRRGGRHIEYGYALGLGKPIILCPHREHFFYHLDDVVCVESVEEVVAALRAGSTP